MGALGDADVGVVSSILSLAILGGPGFSPDGQADSLLGFSP
jgi:hypothetical protein